MEFLPITDDLVEDLLTPDPIQWFDKEMRCSRKGCGSSTYLKIRNIPECMKHALDTANELLKERNE